MRPPRPLLLVLAAALLVGLVPLGVVAERAIDSETRHLTERTLGGIARAQAERMQAYLEGATDRAQLLGNETAFASAMSNYDRTRSAQDRAILTAMLENFRQSSSAIQVASVLDLQGRFAASTDASLVGTPHMQAWQAGRDQARAFLTKRPDSQLTLHAVAPVEHQVRLVGVLELRQAALEIEAMAADFTSLGRTGQTYMGERTGDGTVRVLTPLRGDPGAALSEKEPDDATTPLGLALAGREGTSWDAVDYRGSHVVVATRRIEATGWGLAVKMDRAEALAPVGKARVNLLLTGLLIGAFILGGGVAYERLRRRPTPPTSSVSIVVDVTPQVAPPPPPVLRVRPRLLAAPSEARTTIEKRGDVALALQRTESALQAIPEGVVSMDRRGRIVVANPAMESLLGRPVDALLGRSLADLLSPQSRREFEDGFRHFASTKHRQAVWRPRGLHALRKDGSEVPIELTLAGRGEGDSEIYTAVVRRLHDHGSSRSPRLERPPAGPKPSPRPRLARARRPGPAAVPAPAPPIPPPAAPAPALPQAGTRTTVELVVPPSSPPKIPRLKGGPVHAPTLARLRRSVGDAGAYAERLEDYLEESGSLLAEIRGAVAAGDARSLEQAAAALRKASGEVGVGHLSQLSAVLEAHARRNELHHLTNLLQAMETAHRKARPALRLEQRRLH